MALRPGSGGGGSFMYPVGGGLGPPQGMVPMQQQQQQQQQQQGFPMVPVMQPNMQGMMGMNFGGQMPAGAMPMQGGMALGMQTPGMQFLGQPQYMSMRPAGPQYTADMQKQMAEEHQKRLEQQQKMLEEDRKRRQFEEQKQKLRLLSSVKPKTAEKSRDDALEAIKGNLDGFSRDAKMYPNPSSQTKKPGVGVYPQQEHIPPMLPAWLYNDSLIPEMFKKVLEFTMTPAGIDTANLYPILMSSGLPREALGQIWASANRTTPGMLTKEELYTVLALIGVAQSGLPAMSVEILSQFPSPPVPNLPALAMAMASVMPQHQQPMMTKPPVSMAMPTSAPPVMGMTTATQAQAPTNTNFIASFPPAQGPKADDDDFQDFQEAPKAGAGDQSFTEFQGDSGGGFPTTLPSQHQKSASAMLTPVSGSSSASVTASDKYAVFKQLSVEQPAEPTPTASGVGDKYSVFRQLEQPADKKPVGEGFADFKSVSADDGFTDFKTADSISPLDPSDQAKIFQPSFPSAFPTSQSLQHLPQQQQQQQPAVSLSQPKNPLNMADLDLFSSIAPSVPAPTETKPSTFPSVSVPPPLVLLPGGAKPPGGGADDFGDFTLFGSSSDAAQASAAGGAVAAPQDDFADFMAFGSSGGEPKGESSSVGVQGETSTQQRPQQGSDKYDVFKQLSLEGGLAYDDAKESGGGSFSSLKSDTDDFADFQSSKFCTALGASEKTLVDKVAAFKQAKEDSASVKSLDLPSIGGSSVGKDDSEDALSVQLDMKLSDMGGDLKHVMSDSSLDLPGLSAHQPPATEGDDMKFDPFGTSALSTLSSYDWSDREECLPGEVRKPQGFEGASRPSLVPAQKKELTFGSTENITSGSAAKVPASFPTEDSSSTDDKFEAFADFGPGDQGGVDDEDDFGDFASTVSEKSDSPAATAEGGSEGNQSEASDEFGAFQGDKPKFGKSDFLKASAQTNVKSSEEMIKNELATFDLSVQGSHKRSHSLGDREIGRSPPSPAPEQPFRDRSNTLSEKPALPVIRDKYKDLTGEVEESERYAYEWQRCLESALEVITKANNILNGISSSSVCTEVIQSAQGMEYLLGVVEVYRVTRRVELGIKATAVCSEKLQQLLKDISRVWNNLMGFMSLAKLTPDESSLDFSSCILRHGIKNAKELACGVCLLNVDSRSKAFNSETDNFKLLYGGHQYHASCANFWINCVEPKPPGLILPDLL
ncbi:synergin gamma isoform X7 [Anarrhichthys ocellatus]|uniref:synergin gamma isoform X7 n=1 Tax=Anarrhichthys ocellatus TaxID=433405 RepID=UPI0012ED064B|nr:synergin gamma isoform X7 [Anarrhichthys ocellatus]